MIDLKLSMLREMHNEAMTFHRDYKKKQDRILYYASTLFVGFIALLSSLDILDHKSVAINFSWYHILIVHSIFFILYLLHAHKMLCSEIYLTMASEAENAIQKLFNLNKHQSLNITQLKSTLINSSIKENSVKNNFSLSKIANILIFSLYTFTTVGLYVILKLDLSRITSIKSSRSSNIWVITITTITLLCFVLIDWDKMKRRKSMKPKIRQVIKTRIENLMSANIGYA